MSCATLALVPGCPHPTDTRTDTCSQSWKTHPPLTTNCRLIIANRASEPIAYDNLTASRNPETASQQTQKQTHPLSRRFVFALTGRCATPRWPELKVLTAARCIKRHGATMTNSRERQPTCLPAFAVSTDDFRGHV